MLLVCGKMHTIEAAQLDESRPLHSYTDAYLKSVIYGNRGSRGSLEMCDDDDDAQLSRRYVAAHPAVTIWNLRRKTQDIIFTMVPGVSDGSLPRLILQAPTHVCLRRVGSRTLRS
jgi:hypothetical protein